MPDSPTLSPVQLESELDLLSEKLGESYEEISLIYQVIENVRSASGPEELLQYVLDWTVGEIPAQQAIVEFADGTDKGTTFLSLGANHLSRDDFRELIQHVRPEINGQPLVLNAESTEVDSWPFPTVREFVVVPLPDHRRYFGWLAAVNHADGGWFGSHEVRLLSATATLVGMRVMMQQMEDLQKVVEDGSAEKSRFLRSVSHEIRTPLNGIMSAARSLRDCIDEEEPEAVSDLQTIAGCGAQLTEQVNDILEFSRLESSPTSAGIPCDVREILIACVSTMRDRAEVNGVEIELHESTGTARALHLDPLRLKKLLLTLLRNAIAWSRGGSVHVSAEIESFPERELLIQVRATPSPAGLQRELLASDNGEQAGGFSVLTNGLGLGATICEQIAKSLGGRLIVESEAHKRTAFLLRLPESSITQFAPYETDAVTGGRHSLPGIS